ncbi:hypothetical protein AX15_003119 [Amanita polypyramis BW_CC]|nr:hypothetical protein AX15_003119 [Amanita polypyramis BW_CC]
MDEQVFESTLKEVVQAKRLSARKMAELTEIALKLMEHDTQLVSALYRTHKTLLPMSKVSSLYVFDALSRAARHQVNKQGLSGSLYSEKGNCATFLLKVEGVLEGLFQDMMMIGTEESKEKSQKIIDIWVKGNTFPTTILSRLTKLMKDPEKVTEPESVPGATITPQATPSSASTASPVFDTQAALLALLTQAASATSSEQTSTNTSSAAVSAPAVDPTQLLLLQQLAQKAISSPITNSPTSAVVPPRPSTDSPVPPFSPTGDRAQSPVPPRNGQYDDHRQDVHYERHPSLSPDHQKTHEVHSDHRRGGFRGSHRRGRGDSRGKWDDHDRFRDRDRRRNGRSRSRSPTSRYPSRRDVRLYSPPRRPSISSSVPQRQIDNPDSSRSDEKDEFGRDIRPQPPDNLDVTPGNPTNTRPISAHDPAAVVSSPASSNEQVTTSPLVAANTSSNNSSASFVSSTTQSQAGLENFDPTCFDPTSPSSWELLGKMWQVTYGEMPTTEQLMQLAMQSMTGGQALPAAHVSSERHGPSRGNAYGQGQQRRGRGRGGPARGFNDYGHDGNSWDHYDNNQTDAIVLGSNPTSAVAEGESDTNSTTQENSRAGGGKMQKVGDKWVFVRDDVTQ